MISMLPLRLLTFFFFEKIFFFSDLKRQAKTCRVIRLRQTLPFHLNFNSWVGYCFWDPL